MVSDRVARLAEVLVLFSPHSQISYGACMSVRSIRLLVLPGKRRPEFPGTETVMDRIEV